MEDIEEIEKLSTWYEYFMKSYQQLETEIERRKAHENQMNARINQMRAFIDHEF